VKRMSIAWVVGLAIAATLAPGVALAQRGGMGAHSGSHHHVGPGSGASRSFVHHPFGARSPIIVYAPPFWYDDTAGPYYPPYYPTTGYDPSSAYAPTTAYSPTPGGTISLGSPPPMPSVIEYPTGRFELRGDGITVPYRWVWVPKPPSAPPPAPPSGAPTAPSAPPAARDQEPAGRSTVYRWTDAQGVLHLTDRLDQVPDKYRAQANRTRTS
jgi:hypothetical protein